MAQQDDRLTISTESGRVSGAAGTGQPPAAPVSGAGGGPAYQATSAMAGGLGADPYAGAGPNDQETLVLRRKPQPLAWLIRKNGPRAGQMFRLDVGGTTIGRDAQMDVILDDEAVSRWHARVKYEEVEEGSKEHAFFVHDMASENGTFVNGTRVYRQVLNDGDEVVVGQTALVYKKL
jgi:hypothetical protein